MSEAQSADIAATAGDLTASHVGMVVLDVPGIAGWEDHLLLSSVERDGEAVMLHFRWNDDPAPSNTKRGQYAVGQIVPLDTPVRVVSYRIPPAQPDEDGAR